MVFALLFTLYFAFCGLLLRALVFPKERGLRALWLGLVLGLFGLSWLPALFAFATGRFSLLENLLGALLMGLLAGAGVYYARKQGRCLLKGLSLHREECWPLLALLPLLFIGGYLFSTHILQPKDDSLYVGHLWGSGYAFGLYLFHGSAGNISTGIQHFPRPRGQLSISL